MKITLKKGRQLYLTIGGIFVFFVAIVLLIFIPLYLQSLPKPIKLEDIKGYSESEVVKDVFTYLNNNQQDKYNKYADYEFMGFSQPDLKIPFYKGMITSKPVQKTMSVMCIEHEGQSKTVKVINEYTFVLKTNSTTNLSYNVADCLVNEN